MFDEPTYLDPHSEVRIHGRKLPHWQQDERTYFVTFRLADSLPRELMVKWKEEREQWLLRNPKPWDEKTELIYYRQFSGRIDAMLDHGHGKCFLRSPEAASEVSKVMLRFDGERYRMWSLVVMPNHVHLVFSLPSEQGLPELMRAWKGVSARKVNAITARSGELWQQDYFDRLIRDHEHFVRVVRYVRRNPVKAGLAVEEYLVWESSLVKEWLG